MASSMGGGGGAGDVRAHLSHLFQPSAALVQKEAKVCSVELAITIGVNLLEEVPETLCRVYSAHT